MAEYIDKEALFAEFDRLGLGENSFVEKNIFRRSTYNHCVYACRRGCPGGEM